MTFVSWSKLLRRLVMGCIITGIRMIRRSQQPFPEASTKYNR